MWRLQQWHSNACLLQVMAVAWGGQAGILNSDIHPRCHVSRSVLVANSLLLRLGVMICVPGLSSGPIGLCSTFCPPMTALLSDRVILRLPALAIAAAVLAGRLMRRLQLLTAAI